MNSEIKWLEEIDKYISENYIPENDDLTINLEVEEFFEEISKKIKEKKEELDGELDDEFDESSMVKLKLTKGMINTMSTDRNIEDLMTQLEETFSQRLLRMISDRGLKDSDVYNKARVDRRHFSKIRNDIYYTPNKKTVLAFSIALELSLDETKDLLNCAGFALSRSSKTDLIVSYFLKNKIYNMFEINAILYEYDQPIFE